MKVAVCVKQVIAREATVRVNAAGTWVREDTVTWALNEPDAYALEEALRIKDAHGAEVVAISAGPARVGQVLRECLARGADRAIHVEGDHLASADAATTAHALAAALADEAPDLVLAGLQSDDLGFAEVGLALAERLGAAHATIVMQVDIGAGSVRVKRELEGGWFQWVTLSLPAVLTIQSGINQLRYATLRGIMAAKKKELRLVSAPPPPPSRSRIVSVHVPGKSAGTRLIAGSPAEAGRELIRILRDEERVI
jgi:electron transfer flavoprotein beta subunit